MKSTILASIYADEVDPQHLVAISLDLNESSNWQNKRTYYDLYQSDRQTRVKRFYMLNKPGNKSSDPRNDFMISGRLFSYELTHDRTTPSHNLRASLIELADAICKNM